MARILIVDDSPTQLIGIQRIVEKLGHQTLTAEDGAAGVALAKAELPDLILMDVVMPNLNGFQATRQLSREGSTRDIPVVLVTTKDQDTDRMWGMRQGARAYLTKPFAEAELTEGAQNLKKLGNKVDIIITHEPPMKIKGFLRLKDKEPVRVTGLNTYFEELGAACEYKHWFFGSMHIDKFISSSHIAVFQHIINAETCEIAK